MSAIAYITDPKLLEYHRINVNKEMNFWRISSKTTFSSFDVGDLVFFLSKDKDLIKDKEKGVVGFGIVSDMYTLSPQEMWDKFSYGNGYVDYESFIDALTKASKDHKLPKKISSFYLKNVVFFQAPIYLSECGLDVSKNIESYIYIKPEEIVIKILEFAKNAIDIWSSADGLDDMIADIQLKYAIKLAHNDIGDFVFDEKTNRVAERFMKKVQNANPVCEFVPGSKLDLCLVKNKDVLIVLYCGKGVDKRLLIGHAELYKRYIMKYYRNAYKLYFKTANRNSEIDDLLNRY